MESVSSNPIPYWLVRGGSLLELSSTERNDRRMIRLTKMTPIFSTGPTLGQGSITRLTFFFNGCHKAWLLKGVLTQLSMTLFNTYFSTPGSNQRFSLHFVNPTMYAWVVVPSSLNSTWIMNSSLSFSMEVLSLPPSKLQFYHELQISLRLDLKAQTSNSQHLDARQSWTGTHICIQLLSHGFVLQPNLPPNFLVLFSSTLRQSLSPW